MARRLTVADKLLIAALTLDAGERQAFSAEQLVVAAWEQFPDTFGLRGILDDNGTPRHPDSNRVFAEIMGRKPLRRDGYLAKVADKTYQLTEAGRLRAASVGAQESEVGPRRALSRQLQEDLRRLYRSRAATKSRDGRMGEVTFNDACGFWGISPRSSANDLEAKLAHVQAGLREASELAEIRAILLDPASGLTLTNLDLGALEELSVYLQDLFEVELSVIRKRLDERRSS